MIANPIEQQLSVDRKDLAERAFIAWHASLVAGSGVDDDDVTALAHMAFTAGARMLSEPLLATLEELLDFYEGSLVHPEVFETEAKLLKDARAVLDEFRRDAPAIVGASS